MEDEKEDDLNEQLMALADRLVKSNVLAKKEKKQMLENWITQLSDIIDFGPGSFRYLQDVATLHYLNDLVDRQT